MEPAAHADAALINCFPSFSLPPPPVPKPGASSLARGVGSHGLGGRSAAGPRRYSAVVLRCRGGCACPRTPPGAGGHRGCTPRRHPFPGRAGVPSPGQGIPSPGGRAPPPRGRASLSRGRPRLLPPQPPPNYCNPLEQPPHLRRCRPRGAPDTRYLLTRGPEAAQPPGLQSRY